MYDEAKVHALAESWISNYESIPEGVVISIDASPNGKRKGFVEAAVKYLYPNHEFMNS